MQGDPTTSPSAAASFSTVVCSDSKERPFPSAVVNGHRKSARSPAFNCCASCAAAACNALTSPAFAASKASQKGFKAVSSPLMWTSTRDSPPRKRLVSQRNSSLCAAFSAPQ